ncbi:hypothetical protein AAC387_Pa04g1750 [Persea americana]
MELLNFQNLSHFRNIPSAETGKTMPRGEFGRRRRAASSNEEIKNLCENHQLRQAFELFSTNENEPNSVISSSSYGLLLKACSKKRALQEGRQVHADLIKRGFGFEGFLQTTLQNMYAECGNLDLARQVFDGSSDRGGIVAWNSMIGGYCRIGELQEALVLFCELMEEGLSPDQFTFSVIIEATERNSALFVGKLFQSLSIKMGCQEDEFVGNSLIQMYAKCGSIDDSLKAFDGISGTGSPVCWNSMIGRFAENGFYGDGIEVYKLMMENGILQTTTTFGSVMKACAGLEATWEAKQVHSQLIVHGLISSVILETALVDMYMKCGEIEMGRQVFDSMNERNVITWNSVIRGYSQMGYVEEAFELFGMMRKKEMIVPDKFTFPALLMAATKNSNVTEEFIEFFKAIHAYAIKIRLEANRFVGTSLVAMYSSNQSLEDALLAFEDSYSKDIGLWSSIISANGKNGKAEEALWLFYDMLFSDIKPNQFIYSTLFIACADLSTMETGKQIHGHSLKSGCPLDVAARNALLSMYSNCGCIDEARRIFNSIENPNVISYNSMISAFAKHGLPTEAVQLFIEMKDIRLKPDDITVVALLSSFSHAGLVQEGLELFYSMKENHGVEPSYRHYACIVDLLARAGLVEEAERFVNEMPFKPGPSLWQVILGACSKHHNVEIGERVAETLLELEPNEAITYVLLSNIYTKCGRWVEAERVKNLMVERRIEKDSGVSWIEIEREMHVFGVEDRSHPRSKEIYEKLDELIRKIKEIGYAPDITFAAHNLENERQEESLYYHTEKLAFAFGILSTPPGGPIRIMKNLRVCRDCHNANKYFSLITGRTIILRDNYRFHHFKEGKCSCGDYW